jgi:hypothetical protein
VQANRGRLGEFGQGNAADGHAGEVEAFPPRTETMTGRRFPPPWTVVEHVESYRVQDASGQTFAGCRSCWGNLIVIERPQKTRRE